MATTNFWGNGINKKGETDDRFHFLCLNNHTNEDEYGRVIEDAIPFVTQRGDNHFYACPKYFALDDKHPYGFTAKEGQCHNNLRFKEAEKVINVLMKEYEQSLENGEIVDLTNYKFKVGLIEVSVIVHDENDHIHLGIKNNRAIYNKG